MEDLSGLCFSCMGFLDENGQCPHCAGQALPVQTPPLLPRGTLINGRYYIGKVIKSNGEGASYVAFDSKLERACTLREFFPETIAARDADGLNVVPSDGSQTAFRTCYDAFYKLWTKLQRLKGLTSLISVYDVFKANSTVYAVYSDSEELTLRSYLLSNGAGYISWEQARILFMPLLSTIATLHTSGIVHRGIDPSALILTPDGKIKLTDFCTAQVKTAYGELEADISDGYAPLEVYSEKGETGPWTDIYSFSAVLFRTLVGSTPISAPIRAQNDQMMIPAKFAEQLPPYVINAIINGMQLEEKDRTHNAEQLRSNLSASPRAISASASVFNMNTAALNAQSIRQRPQPAAKPPVSAPAQRPAAPAQRPPQYRAPLSDDDPLTPERIQRARTAEQEANKKESTRKKLTFLLGAILVLLLIGIGLVVSELVNNAGSNRPQPTDVTAATVPETVRIPSFVGKMYDAVTSDSYYTALLTFKTATMSSPTVPRGQIIAQDIPADTVVNKGTCVLLTVSTGPETFRVPDVSGKTYEEALAVLASSGLVCTRNTKYNDGTHKSDTVAETFPTAGTQVSSGDSISIVMWSNADDETTLQDETTKAARTAPAGSDPLTAAP